MRKRISVSLSNLFRGKGKTQTLAKVREQAKNAQALLMGRLLTGKIYECWRVLQTAYFGPGISKIYDPLFEDETREALRSLGRYFGRRNLIEDVRNFYAFHYAPDQIEAGYAKVIEGDLLDIYLSQTNANTLYAFADTVTGRALMESIDAEDHGRALGALITETSKAIGLLNTVIAGIFITCFTRHIGGDLYTLGATIIEVPGAPEWKKVAIPFFIEIKD